LEENEKRSDRNYRACCHRNNSNTSNAFYITYATDPNRTSKKSLHKEYAYNELSTSFISTLLDTSVCGVEVEDLIVDCATARRIRCPSGNNSCDELNEALVVIKNETLDDWDFAYGLDIDMGRPNNITFIKYNCTPDTVGRGAPGVFPISLYPYAGEAWVELGICR